MSERSKRSGEEGSRGKGQVDQPDKRKRVSEDCKFLDPLQMARRIEGGRVRIEQARLADQGGAGYVPPEQEWVEAEIKHRASKTADRIRNQIGTQPSGAVKVPRRCPGCGLALALDAGMLIGDGLLIAGGVHLSINDAIEFMLDTPCNHDPDNYTEVTCPASKRFREVWNSFIDQTKKRMIMRSLTEGIADGALEG